MTVVLSVVAIAAATLWAYPLAPAGLQQSYPAFVKAWYRLPDEGGLRLPAPAADTLPTREPIDTRGTLQTFDGRPAENVYETWPCFRGPSRSNVSGEQGLIRSFGPDGPPRLWEIELGEGYAGPAVAGGMVFLMDYDQGKKANALRCFSLTDGAEIWRRTYPVDIRRQHGISRTVPAVAGDIVAAMGPKCTVVCCEAKTGAYRWGMDLVARYGTAVPRWYAGQCPLINFDGNVVLAPAGRALAVCINGTSGEVIWETPNPEGWTMSHSSLLSLQVSPEGGGAFVNMYLYVAQGGVAGIREEDGEILFLLSDWRVNTATVPTPVDMGGGRIFLSGGYGAGSAIMKITTTADGVTAAITDRFSPAIFGSEQQTPVFHEDHLYGVLSKGAGKNSCRLRCLNVDGEPVWTSGPDDTFGLGPYLIAAGMIIAVDDEGVLTLAAAAPDGYRRLARADVLDGHESWGPLALAGGRLLVRDLKTMVCLDMRPKDNR